MVLGIFALLFGLAALGLSFVPCINLFAVIPGFLGFLFGIIGWVVAAKRQTGKGLSIAGVVLSVLAMTWAPILVFFVLGAMGQSLKEELSSLPGPASSTPSASPVTLTTSRPTSSSASRSRGRTASPRIVTRDPASTTSSTTSDGSAGESSEIQAEIVKLARGAAGMVRNDVWGEVDALRERIDELEDEGNQLPLHEQLDRLIVSVVEVDLNRHYAAAADRYNRNDLRGAKSECDAALQLMTSPDLPLTRTPQDSSVLSGIQALAAQIDMAANPVTRFQVTGFTSMGGEDVANLRDLMTGKRVTAREGVTVGPYTIEAVSKDDGTVTLSDGAKTFDIKR
ncbi:MAG: hypothetical protein GY851_16350 [bacterium]|nr:hypothetical protein [bacterium]